MVSSILSKTQWNNPPRTGLSMLCSSHRIYDEQMARATAIVEHNPLVINFLLYMSRAEARKLGKQELIFQNLKLIELFFYKNHFKVCQITWNKKLETWTNAFENSHFLSALQLLVSKFLTRIHTHHNHRVSLCKPKLIIKAPPPNQQSHPVVWTTCLCCTFTVSIPGQKLTSFSKCHKGPASELRLAPIAQKCHRLFHSCQRCWVNDGSLSWKTWNTCSWTPRVLQVQGLPLCTVTLWLSLIYGGMYPWAHSHSPLPLLSHKQAGRYKALLCAIKAGLTGSHA